ncbi:NAD(P)/FAD-dependent oxidoreductase [Nocardioides sp. NPDC051685]|uniref:NAD(P)/FAD-dependent oxidoreductase n=1 Tax=Nocardioides sp. NPDC051685 TaxID=3364334 RepID=UPI0037B98FDC
MAMKDYYDIAIVGAGHAGVSVATHLVKGGYEGSVALLSTEATLPYKRPPLSKGYLLGTESVDDLPLRSAEYWNESAADLILDAAVTHVDPRLHTLKTVRGDVRYGRLVWTAGGRARSLPTPGVDLSGVYQMRSLEDAERLKAELGSAGRAVVVGAGYIGLEMASALVGLGLDVTVAEAGQRVLERVTGRTVSEFFERVHVRAGVDLRLQTIATAFNGVDDRVVSATLSDGSEVACDVVVLGVGMQANCEVLAAAGAAIGSGVEVDEMGRTSLEGVWAAGDCTHQIHPYARGQRVRLESVQNANDQAKVVASDLLGEPAASDEVPWFWSDQYSIKFKSAGIRNGYDTVITRGDPSTEAFSVLYLAGRQLVAIDCVNRPSDFAQGRALIKRGGIAEHVDFSDLGQPLKAAEGVVAGASEV